jgi:hypothetical protein
MRPKMIALNAWMPCAFPSSFLFTFPFHCKRMFVSTSTYILTFLTKALNWTCFLSSKFTFVEVSIFLVFYFQIWDLWESNNYLKLDRSPLSSSISFHCAYICSPVAITSLNLLINFKFCLFYSHSHYTSLLLLIWTLLTQMVSLHFYQILKVSLKSSTSWKSHLNQ